MNAKWWMVVMPALFLVPGPVAHAGSIGITFYGLKSTVGAGHLDETIASDNAQYAGLVAPLRAGSEMGIGARINLSREWSALLDATFWTAQASAYGPPQDCHQFYWDCWPDTQSDVYHATVESSAIQVGAAYWGYVSPRLRAGISGTVMSVRSKYRYSVSILGGESRYGGQSETSLGASVSGRFDLKVISILHLEGSVGLRGAGTSMVNWSGLYGEFGPALYF